MNASTMLVVAHQPLLRLGIRTALGELGGGSVFVESDDMARAVNLVRRERPALAVLSACEVAEDVPRWVRDIRKQVADQRVVVLIPQPNLDLSRRMLDAGVLGLVTLRDDLSELGACARSALAGSLHLSKLATTGLVGHLRPHRGASGKFTTDSLAGFSNREMEVFQRMGHGLSNKEIAAALCVSTKTVESHKLRMRIKLGLERSSELTRLAVRQSLQGSQLQV